MREWGRKKATREEGRKWSAAVEIRCVYGSKHPREHTFTLELRSFLPNALPLSHWHWPRALLLLAILSLSPFPRVPAGPAGHRFPPYPPRSTPVPVPCPVSLNSPSVQRGCRVVGELDGLPLSYRSKSSIR